MSFNVFENSTGPFNGVTPHHLLFCKNLKYGIRSDVDITVKSQYEVKGLRKGAMFTNTISPFGVLKATLTRDIDSFDGYNAEIIGGDGRPTASGLYDALKRTGRLKPYEVDEMADQFSQFAGDNHVSVLYNMLRLWCIRTAETNPAAGVGSTSSFRDEAATEGDFLSHPTRRVINDIFTFRNDDLFYDDGYVNISYKDYLGRRFDEAYALEAGDELNVIVSNVAEANLFGFAPVMRNMVRADIQVLAGALSRWGCDYPVRLCHSSPSLSSTVTVPLSMSNLVGKYKYDTNVTPKQILSTLNKYVSINRIEAQFDMAYTMLVQAMYAPLPMSVEANGWVSPVNAVIMPEVSSYRGLLPSITRGARYEPYPEARLTWANFSVSPNVVAVHAMCACESFFTGIFEILTASTEGNYEKLEALGVASCEDATPYRMYLEAATYRYGKAHETLWHTVAGVDMISHLFRTTKPAQLPINVTGLGSVNCEHDVYEIVEGNTTRYRVRALDMRPALYPVLSMGINTDRYYNNAFNYDVEMRYDPAHRVYVMDGAQETNKVLTALKIMGYNATVTAAWSNRKYRNWTSNAASHMLPMVPPDMFSKTQYAMCEDEITRRKACWAELPLTGEHVQIKLALKVNGKAILASGKHYLSIVNQRRVTRLATTPGQFDPLTAVIRVVPGKLPYASAGFRLAEVPREVQPPATLQPEAMRSPSPIGWDQEQQEPDPQMAMRDLPNVTFGPEDEDA